MKIKEIKVNRLEYATYFIIYAVLYFFITKSWFTKISRINPHFLPVMNFGSLNFFLLHFYFSIILITLTAHYLTVLAKGKVKVIAKD